MEAKEEIYQYIKENRKEGVTAQDIAEIFGISDFSNGVYRLSKKYFNRDGWRNFFL